MPSDVDVLRARFDSSKIREVGSTQPVPNEGGLRRAVAYLRIYPYWLQRRLLKRLDRRGDHVGLYLHPWEVAPDPPRPDLPFRVSDSGGGSLAVARDDTGAHGDAIARTASS